MSTIAVLLNQAMKVMGAEPGRAAALLRAALETDPGNLDAGLLLSEALRLSGDLASARDVITPLAAANPRHFGAQRQLGIILAANRAPLPAALALRAASELTPEHPTIWRDLADQLTLAGDVVAAENAYLRHLNLRSMDPPLGRAAETLRAGNLGETETLLLAYLRTNPSDVVALRMLGETQARAGKYPEAEQAMRRVIALAPAFKQTRHDLTLMLMGLGRVDDALSEADALLKLDPASAGARRARAAVLNSAGEYEQALEIYEALLREDPGRAATWTTIGHIEKTLGNTAKSISAYRRSIALAPQLSEAYWGLANLKTVELNDSDVEAIRTELRRAPTERDRVNLYYALGRALEQRGDIEASFAAYAQGAKIRAGEQTHDSGVITALVDQCVTLHDKAFFQRRAGSGDLSPDPILILGLPRSGSTLVEQILASHSQVEGTMELADLGNLVRHLAGSYPSALDDLSPDRLREMGATYLRTTHRRRKAGTPFFIDKMPNNWTHIALIQLVLPNAKIIDARRHPMACGWSCFKEHFALGQDFSYDLTDIGRYYADYVRLMAHYDDVLHGRIHRVIHEELVTDPEPHVRALLDYCGLAFEEQCLRPHETKRAVHTASAEQVRRPINAKGLNDWRAFEAYLGPLKTALGPVLDAYPAAPK